MSIGESTDLLAPEHLLRRSVSIAADLLRTAEPEPGGAITWHRGYTADLSPARDAGIFNGRMGEALFFAALFSTTGDPAHEEAALGASQAVRAGAADAAFRERLLARVGYGLTGVGSQVYALVRMSQFLNRPELLDDAAALAQVLTPERIAHDRRHELFWGAAGAALGLLALYDHTGDPAVLARAVACGDHLLARRGTDPETGLRAWATLEPALSTGFAHGSSGIACALLRLHQATDEARFYDAAIEAFAWERTVYREDVGDWPDTRGQPTEEIISGWCHGAPGMVLSRLAALYVLREGDEGDVVGDLDRALTRTSESPLRELDHLCCGNFGIVDILLEAGRVLENDSLVRQSQRLAQATLEAVDERGWGIAGTAEDGSDRHLGGGLWQGTAGIGYTLLRMTDPDRYPTLLSWG
ncbi:MAG TPA: lanthionine synthetase LanC family protein [Longimicrobium sp.]|nr:lanthionine synthetase LanC family protein [Longimicrobium sp.]